MEIIKENKKKILSYMEKVAMVILLSVMSIVTFLSAEQLTQVKIDQYAWGGIMLFFCALLISFRLNLKNRYIYITGILYAILFLLYTLHTGYIKYEHEWLKVLFCKGMVYGILVLMATDAATKKRFCRFKELDLVKIGSAVVTCVAIHIVPNGILDKAIPVAFVICTFIIFEKDRTESFLVCYSWANIIGATTIALWSLITHPYAGERRYYGAFTYLHGFGMYIGSGIVCCIFLIMYVRIKHWNKKRLLVSVIPFLLALLYAFVLINSRGALLGVVAAIIVFVVLLSKVTGKKRLIGRISLVVVIAVFLLGGVVVYLGIFYDRYKTWLEKVPLLSYMATTVQRTIKAKSRTGIFPDGTILTAIDRFTSSRLSIWKVTVENLKWFKGNSMWITVSDWTTGTHNTYLGFLNGFGIVVGGLFIVLLFYVFIKAIKIVKADTSNGVALFTVFWYAFSLLIFINEMVYFSGYYMILCLFALGVLRDNKSIGVEAENVPQ